MSNRGSNGNGKNANGRNANGRNANGRKNNVNGRNANGKTKNVNGKNANGRNANGETNNANGNGNTANLNRLAFVSQILQNRKNVNLLNRKSLQTALMYNGNRNTIVTPYQRVLLKRFIKLITIFGCRDERYQSVSVRNDPYFYAPLMRHIEDIVRVLPTNVTILTNYLYIMLNSQTNTAFKMNEVLCRKYAGIIVGIQKNGNRFINYDNAPTSMQKTLKAIRLLNDVKSVVADVKDLIKQTFNVEVVRVWTEYQRFVRDLDLLLQTIDSHPFPHQLYPILYNTV